VEQGAPWSVFCFSKRVVPRKFLRLLVPLQSFLLCEEMRSFLLENFFYFISTHPQLFHQLAALGQLVLAFFLGGVLGLQRERHGKAAGTRTYALVSAGAGFRRTRLAFVGWQTITPTFTNDFWRTFFR
jgi:hypothetical protein